MTTEKKRKALTVRVNEDLLKRAKMLALQKDVSLQEILEKYLIGWVTREERKDAEKSRQ